MSDDCFLIFVFTDGLLVTGFGFILPKWAFLQEFRKKLCCYLW